MSTMAKMQFGVLLPHFGKECSPARIIDGSKMCEELGFDSVWVRDHLIWHPHGMEKSGLKFVEPIVTLSAVAAVTKRIIWVSRCWFPCVGRSKSARIWRACLILRAAA